MNEANKLHDKAKSLAKTYIQSEAEILRVLMEMKEKNVFPILNYSGIFDYCLRALKLSRAQSYYFQSVATKSVEVPEIASAILQGELTLSQARRIVPVVTPENKAEWISKAQSLGQDLLEREVAAQNPKAQIRESIKPVSQKLSKLTLCVDEETEQNLLVLKELLSSKLSKNASLADVLKWISQECREKFDPERRAARSEKRVYGKIKSRENANPKAKIVPKASLAKTNPVNRTPIPLSEKHEVIRRKGARCHHLGSDGRRCEQLRWLHFHHLVPVSHGGTNHADNLILLCRHHHAWIHQNEKSTNPQIPMTGLPNSYPEGFQRDPVS